MFDRILVVCVGNICRSPTGEALLRNLLSDKVIESAGISTKKSGLIGHKADDSAIQVAAEHGLDLNFHQAKQLTSELADKFDLILVMESDHINMVAQIAPQSRHKVLLFGQWGEGNIADPYRKDQAVFAKTFQILDAAARSWATRLK